MLEDMKLADLILGDVSWLALEKREQLDFVENRFQAWDSAVLMRVANYAAGARQRIGSLFTRLHSLV